MPSAITDRLIGISSAVAYKAPVLCATTTNITLSGLQTIDGVALAEDDRVLVKDQTNTAENGIFVASTGEWSRATDFDSESDVRKGTLVFVTDGSTNAARLYWVSTADPSPGSALAFTLFAA